MEPAISTPPPLGPLPAIAERQRPASRTAADRASRAAKRALDLAVAVPLLLALVPAVAVLAVAVRLDSPGPALFHQRRVGRHGRAITVWKLRTMHVDAEDRLAADAELRRRYLGNGFKLRIAEDPRVTRLGRWLRRTSLDELPQLWNVVNGSMSLVGPRPVLDEELVKLYGERADTYTSVRPGLTGLWQVNGRSHVTGPSRVALDLDYIARRSLVTDLGILCRTIPAVVVRRGAL